MEKRVFSGKAMRAVEEALEMDGDWGTQLAPVVREAMNRINSATDTIRSCVTYLRRDLDEVMTQVDGGYTVRQIGHQSPADLREAIKTREIYFSVLVEIIGPDEVQRYMEMK